jgi:plastocyanin
MGDPVRVMRTSPGRPGTGGIVVAWALAVGVLLAALAMLAPAAGAQPMYNPQDQMMQPQEQQMQAPAPSAPAGPADQYTAPSTTTAAAQQQGQETTVSIQDFFFSPAQITVQPGTTVTWMNNGQAPHTVTADDGSFDSETLQPGQSFSFTFANAGTFSYFCEIHPFMTGSVTVVGGDGGGGSGGGGAATPQASAQTGSVTATAQQASAKATAGGQHMLPQTGGLPPLLPTVSLLLGCGVLGGGALWRRARRTTATKSDV